MSKLQQVLITGANGGLGLASTKLLLSHGIHVFALARTREGLQHIQEQCADVNVSNLSLMLCDLNRGMYGQEVLNALHQVDGVVNNAGSAADLSQTRKGEKGGSVLLLDWDDFQRALWINAEAARRIMRECVPSMLKRNFGRIVNVSSARASLGTIIGEIGSPSYDLSKLLLNGLTAHLGHELQGTNVLVNSLCPGWCKTAMGGPDAIDTPEEGAKRIVALLDLPEDAPNGRFYMNNEIVPF